MALNAHFLFACLLCTSLISACSKSEQTEPVEQTKQEQTEPEQTEPEQTEPEQTEQEQAEQEQPVGGYDYWPNPLSQTNGDQWLIDNHDLVTAVNPKLLVLNFGNTRSPAEIDSAVNSVINAFAQSSRADGYKNPDAAPQLNYQLVKLVDLRDGIDDRPDPAPDYPYENSSLYPRPATNPESQWLDYRTFFSDDFAKWYGYEDPNNANEFLNLCELIETGTINELWFTASGDVPDAAAYEVLESKQVYNANSEATAGEFNRCAGNGCFDLDVPVCSRSVRVGFVNESRGPGCYLHSQGHGIESFGQKNVVPNFSKWFVPFAGFDLNSRYGTPFDTFYGACNLNQEMCLTYPTTTSVTVSGYDTYNNYMPFCGNVHFPPNADNHYGSNSAVEVASRCDNFGRPNSVGVTETTNVSNVDWAGNTYAQDCSGEFLSWWYQHMPANGTGRQFENGEGMQSVWPFLFY